MCVGFVLVMVCCSWRVGVLVSCVGKHRCIRCPTPSSSLSPTPYTPSYSLHLLPQAFGVADGVWGWRNQGIDSGIFSRAIMAEAAAQVRRKRATVTERKSPSDLLKHAVDRTREAKHLGSST